MSGIFISYRRQDSQGSAGRLADTLKAQFAHNQIFRDVETIEPGVDFVDAIERALGSCVVLLAVIGPRWLSAADKSGRRRLDDSNDYTRIEIAAALQRKVRVIPVLVDGAAMPDAEELPDDLKTLARRQASELSDKRWDFDVHQLVQTIEKIPGIEKRSDLPLATAANAMASAQPGPTRGAKTGLWVGLAAAVLIGIALAVWHGASEESTNANTRSNPPVYTAKNDDGAVGTAPTATQGPASTTKREIEPKIPAVGAQVPERPKILDISGSWVDLYGNRYLLTQQDNSVAIRMVPNPLGRDAEGRGTLSGRSIAMDYAVVEPSVGYRVGKVNVEVSGDGNEIRGTYVEPASGVMQPFILHR